MTSRLAMLALIGACAFFASPIANAEEAAPASNSDFIGKLPPETKLRPNASIQPSVTAEGSGMSKLGIYFVTLCGLAVGGFYVIKRGLPIRTTMGSENRLHLRETKMLGNRQFLVVAEYEGSRILLGVGPGRIEYLCPLESVNEPSISPLSTREPK